MRIEDFILILRVKGIIYQVTSIQRQTGSHSYLFKCHAKDGEERQIKVNATGLLTAFQEVVDEGQRTGSKMLLIMNADTLECKMCNLNQVKGEFPPVAELLKRMEQKGYIS